MGNPMVDDLVRKMRSGRITRRHSSRRHRARSLRDIDQLGPPRQPGSRPGRIQGHLLDNPHRTGPERLAEDRRQFQ